MTSRFRLLYVLPASMLLAISADASSGETSVETEVIRSYDPAKLRSECHRLDGLGVAIPGKARLLDAFIDALANSRDRDALRLIITEELPGLVRAAARYAKLFGPKDVFRFAQKFHSYHWWSKRMCVFGVLSTSYAPMLRVHLRAEVLSPFPWTRACCYEFCLDQNWGDLVDAAWADLDSDDRLYEGSWADGTLGDLAWEYLSRFEKRRPVPPRKRQVPPEQ